MKTDFSMRGVGMLRHILTGSQCAALIMTIDRRIGLSFRGTRDSNHRKKEPALAKISFRCFVS
jgi:hypothetical protein